MLCSFVSVLDDLSILGIFKVLGAVVLVEIHFSAPQSSQYLQTRLDHHHTTYQHPRICIATFLLPLYSVFNKSGGFFCSEGCSTTVQRSHPWTLPRYSRHELCCLSSKYLEALFYSLTGLDYDPQLVIRKQLQTVQQFPKIQYKAFASCSKL